MTPRIASPREAPHPSRLALEQAAFDPAGAPRPANVAAHLAACEACASRVAEMRAERDAFLVQRPPAPFLNAIAARRGPSWVEAWRNWLPWTMGAVAVAAVALWVVPVAGLLTHPNESAVRFKGGEAVRLELFASREGREAATALDADSPLHRGDVLKVAVTVPSPGYVLVENLDDRGRVTRYFPAEGPRSASIGAGRSVLPGSVVLDDFVGEERVFVLFSARPLADAEAQEALKSAFRAASRPARIEHLDLPASWTAQSIRKEAPLK